MAHVDYVLHLKEFALMDHVVYAILALPLHRESSLMEHVEHVLHPKDCFPITHVGCVLHLKDFALMEHVAHVIQRWDSSWMAHV